MTSARDVLTCFLTGDRAEYETWHLEAMYADAPWARGQILIGKTSLQ